MAEELQELLNRINQDYLKQAESEKESILTAARAEAAKIVADAKAAAEAAEADAEKAAEGFRMRAEAAAKQAARDVVLALRNELQTRLERVVGESSSAALTPEFMAGIIRDMAAQFQKDPSGDVTILCAKRDAAALESAIRGTLRGSLAAQGNVFPNAGIRAGLQVSFNGSDVYFDFTEEAVRDLLRNYLGAELAKLLDNQNQ